MDRALHHHHRQPAPRLPALILRVYAGTIWDWATYVGTLGLFLALFFLFVRLVPMISMSEMRELLHEKRSESH